MPASWLSHWLRRIKFNKAFTTPEFNLYLADPSPNKFKLQGYSFSTSELWAVDFLLKQLNLNISRTDFLRRVGPRLSTSDTQQLIALLNFLVAAQQGQPDLVNTPQSAVRRVTRFNSIPSATFRRRNILFVTSEFPNPMHGGGGRVADFIKVLSQTNNIYLYSVFHESLDAQAYAAIQPYCYRLQKVGGHQTFATCISDLRTFIAGVDIDIVHYEWPRALALYDPDWGHRHIFTFMEAISLRTLRDLNRRQVFSPEWLRLFVELIKTLKVELCDTARMDELIVVTKQDGELYARLNPNRDYIVLNHGVNFAEFPLPDVPTEDKALTFVGNFLHYPNLDAVTFFCDQVLPLIQRQEPEVKLYLVGAHPPSSIQARHDGQHIIVTGTVTDIRPYIQRAAVCVAPLVTGAGLRSKVIQYAALKRPCVATSIAATDLQFENGQEILIADTPEQFATYVVELLKNPQLARQMAEVAYNQAVQYYDTRLIVNRLAELYGEFEG